MRISYNKTLFGRATRTFKERCFTTRNDGFAAIEFALILPILLTLFLGGVSVFDAQRAWSTLGRTSSTIVDLVSRQAVMDDDIRATMFAAGDALAGKYGEGNDFQIIISSLTNPVDNENDPEVFLDWSVASVDGYEIEADDVENLPIPLIAEGDSLILVTVRTTYSPLLGTSVVHDWDIDRTVFRRPRFVRTLAYE